ncbi:helix-turn-helix domain-containing protein [Clostridium beijerinckii]|uniref:Transcriptional regulator with XRE-family HTH domain n=1 Tax=Clostridium beijerinckii TaxID=1520 RepID=A0A1S8RWV6_CLOBE|nr:helix-turn-helix transcriptional regulator [Clostridium beijerinckii]MBA8934548.1 transcriptional regulator with XRE-family HTH domain [Clostridium beijerinckii]NRT35554.1 transcriptional regulator with XRE-family HTH domain [Clostridium beijerinckii]NRT45018.1 transcriptional regulator with XRE-family HTH domain [Clostridium beijerinckii]NRU38734.1 transcriptional regulator with XRE-family HTH domain [Clostridium beijerinckii]NRZ20986.1 transcriptional regulator with XRE-family HTH domain 
MFSDRLEKYRSGLYLKRKEMADKLQVSESYYSLIESGKRSPSKNFIEKLVVVSELPEEYWIYGINQEDYINTRDEFKSLKKALDTILDLGYFNNVNEIFDENNDPKDSLGRLLISALKADISCMIEKRKGN